MIKTYKVLFNSKTTNFFFHVSNLQTYYYFYFNAPISICTMGELGKKNSKQK